MLFQEWELDYTGCYPSVILVGNILNQNLPAKCQEIVFINESYDYSFDPALLFKLGTPLYRFTKLPLELDLILQWGWRTPEIRIGFYRETRPTYASISLGITYVFEMFK